MGDAPPKRTFVTPANAARLALVDRARNLRQAGELLQFHAHELRRKSNYVAFKAQLIRIKLDTIRNALSTHKEKSQCTQAGKNG